MAILELDRGFNDPIDFSSPLWYIHEKTYFPKTWAGFTSCFTHGRMKYSLIKQIDPEGVKEAKSCSIRDRVDLRSSDHFRNYFTSVEVHLDKTGEEFEKRYNEPTIKYSHHPKEKEKGVDEEGKLGSPLFCYNEDKKSMGNGKKSFGLVGIVVTVTWEKLQNMPEISPLDVPGCICFGKDPSKIITRQPKSLVRTFLNLHTEKDWILSVLNGEHNDPLWEYTENEGGKWWQRSSGIARFSLWLSFWSLMLISILFSNISQMYV